MFVTSIYIYIYISLYIYIQWSSSSADLLLLLDHLCLGVLQARGVDRVLVQALEELQGVEDALVGVILVQRRLPLVDLAHVLRNTHTDVNGQSCFSSSFPVGHGVPDGGSPDGLYLVEVLLRLVDVLLHLVRILLQLLDQSGQLRGLRTAAQGGSRVQV